MRRFLFPVLALCFFATGCDNDSVTKPSIQQPPPNHRSTPQEATRDLITSYEKRDSAEYVESFTGDYTWEFSTSTDPTLVQQFSTGWFKKDEEASAGHLFHGYTPPGGATLPAATKIDIALAVDLPADDNSGGVDPITHKALATRVDGDVTVPQSGSEPLTYVITNNYHVFYLVRGDAAVGLDGSQPADAQHWYIYRWVDLTSATPQPNRPASHVTTWAFLKALYR